MTVQTSKNGSDSEFTAFPSTSPLSRLVRFANGYFASLTKNPRYVAIAGVLVIQTLKLALSQPGIRSREPASGG